MNFLDEIKNFGKESLNLVETVETKTVIIESEKSNPNFWHFGHQDEHALIEYFDEPTRFRQKCKDLAQLIRDANYVVVYTGAGISTSAKLPDYRGENGMWTNRDRGTDMDKSQYTTIAHALPTLAHMALAKLADEGIVKSVVSTNVDGLHMRSGLVKGETLSELHGNAYLEVCQDCGERYLRDYDVISLQTPEHRLVDRHWCGGICDKEGCNGKLLDTIVAFKEFLPEDELEDALQHSQKGDLALVLGTSMHVEPACLLPKSIYKKKNGHMVICNLQTTPFDNRADFNIRGHIDDIMYLVMQELGIEIPFITPAGNEIPSYVENIDAKHEEKVKEIQKKLKELEEKEPDVLDNALVRGENIYKRIEITEKNVERTVSKYAALNFFTSCEGCNYIIDGRCTKVVIENCNNCTFTFNGQILTQCVEVINSDQLTVNINTPVHTLTVDNVQTVEINYHEKSMLDMIVWSQSKTRRVTVAGEEIPSDFDNNYNPKVDQYMTYINAEDNEFVTQKLQRDDKYRVININRS